MPQPNLSLPEEEDSTGVVRRPNEGVLDGKTVVFIGSGGLSKFQHYRDVRAWGARVVLLQDVDDNTPSECADQIFSVPNLFDHSRDEDLEGSIIGILRTAGIVPDGILTLWEDCGPLSARLARSFKVSGVDPTAAQIAKSKFETQRALSLTNDPFGNSLGSKCFRCRTTDEVRAAMPEFDGHALLKLEYGSSAVGVVAATNTDEAVALFERITRTFRTEKDCPGVGLGFGISVVITELLSGREFDVDLVMSTGTMVAAFVTDNSPTRADSFSECMARMPSQIPPDEQAILVQAAFETCRTIGLNNGAFNIEFTLTDDGPKVIDVNARMGGFYIRDWIAKVWNYDILFSNVYCSLGLVPPRGPLSATGAIVGAMLLPSIHGPWLSDSSNINRLLKEGNSGDILVNVFTDRLVHTNYANEPWGSVGVYGSNRSEASRALRDLWKRVGLDQYDPDLETLFPDRLN